MSFGVSLSDIISVVTLAKETVQNCRSAPNDFAEASRVSQSLYLMLEGVKNEYQNPDSPLHKDERTRTDFAIHFKNCETSLKPLADLIDKYKSLSSSNIRLIDRMRYPKKEFLEYRGNLAFYTARLSEFLHMVGLGSLGRIEQKVEDIKEHLPNLMDKLDQMCAEFRIMGDKESLLSDHTDDEKFVWKAFRTKLNEAGFTSKTLREHEAAIFLRIRELTECGLLETDGSTSVWTEDEVSNSPPPVYQMPFRLGTTVAYAESDAESEKTITPKPSIRNLRSKKSTGSMQASWRRKSEPSPTEQNSSYHRESLPRRSALASNDMKDQTVSVAEVQSSIDSFRIWRNSSGEAILKGTLSHALSREGQRFLAVTDTEKQEVLIPFSNLSEADMKFANLVLESSPKDTHHVKDENVEPLPSYSALPGKTNKDKVEDPKDQPIDVPRRTHPQILVGKRTRPEIRWVFRQAGSELPVPAPYCSRSLLTSDRLPEAASRGDIGRVKKLLAAGEHIESKGPESWTETVSSGDGETTSKRHSYPETTALYRAAYAGWVEIAHYLLSKGADVNTRYGYDGVIGDPILFDIIRHGDEKMARLLLEFGAKMESFGPTTALHVASSCPKRSLVRLVLDYGAYIDAKDHHSRTPLYLASVGGFASIVELLLEEGARSNKITSEGQSALYKAGGKGRDDIVELLLRYGADPAVGRGRFGETTIYKAAWYDELETVELLLNFEGDVNIRNNKKMKSYKNFREKVFHGVVAGLSKEHAVMNAWDKTALHAATYRGHEEMVQILINAGADLEAIGSDGLTPLYLAAQQKHKGIVQMLLKAGAQLETEKHDPVLALLGGQKRARSGKGKEVTKKEDHRREMAKMGTSDPLVSFVADLTKSLSKSRRITAPKFL